MKILHEFENSFCHKIRIMQKSSDKKNCTMLTYWQLSPVKSQAITSSPVKSNLHLRCYQNIGTEKADSAFLPVANHTQQRAWRAACYSGTQLPLLQPARYVYLQVTRPETSRQSSYRETQMNLHHCVLSAVFCEHAGLTLLISFLWGCETSCKSLSPLQERLLTLCLLIWKIIIKILLVNKTLVVPLLSAAMKPFRSQCSFITSRWENLVSFKNIKVSKAQSCESQKAFTCIYV